MRKSPLIELSKSLGIGEITLSHRPLSQEPLTVSDWEEVYRATLAYQHHLKLIAMNARKRAASQPPAINIDIPEKPEERELLKLTRVGYTNEFHIYEDGELAESYVITEPGFLGVLPIKMWRHFKHILEKRTKQINENKQAGGPAEEKEINNDNQGS
jgi:hypothetical protein